MRRTTLTSLLLAAALGWIASLAGLASAQPRATATVVFLREAGATRAQTTYAGMGVRRGIQTLPNVDFESPVDALEQQTPNEDVEFALARLDPLADQMQTGDTADAARGADEVVETLESHLDQVRRSQLVDAYMISAAARCLMGQRRECQRRFSQVLVFREGVEYDATRYGEAARAVFDRARAQTVSGPRGSLVIHTEPEGAEVFIDGRSHGPSPIRAEGLLAGWHYVTVKELGFERLETRVEVERNRERSESYSLAPGDRSVLLGERALGRLRGQLGETRASPDLVSLFRGTIPLATQVIVGVARPAAAGGVHVQLYLYHMATRALQSQSELTITADLAGSAQMEAEIASLYEGVDLSGGLEAPEDDTVVAGPQPELYEQWWFWVAVIGGAALVATGIAIGVSLESASRQPAADRMRIGVLSW